MPSLRSSVGDDGAGTAGGICEKRIRFGPTIRMPLGDGRRLGRESPGPSQPLNLLGVEADEGHHLRQVLQLHQAAAEAEDGLTRRNGRLTGRARKREAAENFQNCPPRFGFVAFARLPVEWFGKRYRRTQGQPTETAREEGERAERAKAAQKAIAAREA